MFVITVSCLLDAQYMYTLVVIIMKPPFCQFRLLIDFDIQINGRQMDLNYHICAVFVIEVDVYKQQKLISVNEQPLNVIRDASVRVVHN